MTHKNSPILLVALALSALAGCGQPLTPAKHAEVDRVECKVDALAPLALKDAEALVHDLEDGLLGIDDIVALATDGKADFATAKTNVARCDAQFPKLASN